MTPCSLQCKRPSCSYCDSPDTNEEVIATVDKTVMHKEERKVIDVVLGSFFAVFYKLVVYLG